MTELKLVTDLPLKDRDPGSLVEASLPPQQEPPIHNFYAYKKGTLAPDSEPVRLKAVAGGTASNEAPVAGTSQQEVLEYARNLHQVPEANGMVGGVGGIGGPGRQYHHRPTSSVSPAELNRREEIREANRAELRRQEELNLLARHQQQRDDRIFDLFKATEFRDLPNELHDRLFNRCRDAIGLFERYNPGIIPVVVYFPQSHNFVAVRPEEVAAISISNVSSGGLSSSAGGGRQGSQNQNKNREEAEEGEDADTSVGEKVQKGLRKVGKVFLRLLDSDPAPSSHPNYKADTREVHLLCGMVNRLINIADEISSSPWKEPYSFAPEIEELRGDIKILSSHLFQKRKISEVGLDAAHLVSNLAQSLYSDHRKATGLMVDAIKPLLCEQ